MARLLGKCLQTRAEVSPGHLVKKPEVMAAVQVDTAGLKSDQWRSWKMPDLVESAWTLLDNGECVGMSDAGD